MERLERPRQERNVESERRAFIEAVSITSIEEIPTVFDESAAEALLNSLKSTKLFILGEMHGVKENVDVIYTLFKKFGFRQLALEWEPELQQMAEMFLESGELNFTVIQDSPDGRITAGHFALLRKLRVEGLLDRLICFDDSADIEEWNERDAAMARTILTNLSDVPTLVVAGNLHAKTDAMLFDDEPGEHHPMGEHIQKIIPTVASGGIEYGSGQYHNYGTQTFSEIPGREGSAGACFSQDETGHYVFEIPVAHTAVVPHPHEKL